MLQARLVYSILSLARRLRRVFHMSFEVVWRCHCLLLDALITLPHPKKRLIGLSPVRFSNKDMPAHCRSNISLLITVLHLQCQRCCAGCHTYCSSPDLRSYSYFVLHLTLQVRFSPTADIIWRALRTSSCVQGLHWLIAYAYTIVCHV